MNWKRFPIFLLALAITSSCAHPVDTPLGCPPGPELAPMTDEMWQTLPQPVREYLFNNAVAWEHWHDLACGRINIHDSAL